MRGIHNIHTTSDSEIQYTKTVPRFPTHSGHCNASASEASDRRKERQRARRTQIAQEKRERKLAAKQTKKMPKIPAENVNIPAKVVTNIQNINITMNSSVNIQVVGETSQQSTQTAELDQVLDGLRAKPYVNGKHIIYTDKDLEVPEKTSRNNTQKVDPKTDSIIISDDEQILISSDDEDYIYSEISDSDGGEDVTESDAGEAGDDITETYASSAYDTVLVEPDWECIKLEDISDKETEIISTTSVLENTSSKSRKRKDNSFVRDSIPKKSRGN